MPPTHSLLTVHAHPDDETISTGGEHGEIVVPELDTPENHARLRAIRADELARALAQLGPIDSRNLGYVDSGMMGTPQNDEPGSFWTADLDEAAGRLVRIVRETRPQVIVGYNDFGGYGHPDHIRSAQVAKLAFARAGDPAWYPEQLTGGLSPWTPAKLYETVMDMTRRQELLEIMQQRGVRTWLTGREDETDEERAEREAHVARMAAAAGPKTTSVDVREVLDAKVAAIREHVTQIAEGSWFLALTPDEWRQYQPAEDFTLRVARTGLVEIPESDLFAGLPPEA
jgi:N-acetyl-1-D-myo-inositol-2-amino-2-deoxy-alpha-D-glucopyranoside deacetylase